MEVEPVFEVHEVDLDYEFDAAMCFDFTRPETQAETLRAELWFQSAQEYPPSPFVAKLEMREDILMENVNTSPKSKDMESIIMDADVGVSRDLCALDTNNKDRPIATFRRYHHSSSVGVISLDTNFTRKPLPRTAAASDSVTPLLPLLLL